MKNKIRKAILSGFVLINLAGLASAAPIVRSGAGVNAAAIQSTVDQFRTDLGTLNPNTTSTFANGRREINWDGVPDAFSLPNFFPSNFFNSNSPRGVIFGSPASNSGNDTSNFLVSANTASGTAVRFGNIDASYSSIFQTFSAERLFTVRSSNANSTVVTINFFIPGTDIPAGVSGFGAVFCDVDSNINAIMRVYLTNGRLATVPISVTAFNNGLSFLGVSFNAGEKIARVEILSGNQHLLAGNIDGSNGLDLIVMDDFIYGEPHATQFHSGDFDGDGVTDSNIFRPATGQWFAINSGTNTASIVQWGQAGDIPVDGDFDGDSLADRAIFRPSDGSWWLLRSQAGALALPFGTNGDRPVAGDYDRDGKTDIAIWRPSNGNFFVLRSSAGFQTFFGYPFGQAGDIPVQGAAQ